MRATARTCSRAFSRALVPASLLVVSSPAFACANTMHEGESDMASFVFFVAAVASAMLFLGAVGMATAAGLIAWRRG